MRRSPTYVAPLMVPLDYCFKDLKDVSGMLSEEPLASYSGVLPHRIKLAPPPAAAQPAEDKEAEDKEKKKEKKASKARGSAPEPDEPPVPYRYVVNTVRLNNNLLTSIAGLPTALSQVCADLSALQILDLSFNHITSVDPAISQLYNLSVLRLHANSIKNFEAICHVLPLTHLHRLTLMNNPLDQHSDYRNLACALIPTLKAFDNVLITASEESRIESYKQSPRGRQAIMSIHRAKAKAGP